MHESRACASPQFPVRAIERHAIERVSTASKELMQVACSDIDKELCLIQNQLACFVRDRAMNDNCNEPLDTSDESVADEKKHTAQVDTSSDELAQVLRKCERLIARAHPRADADPALREKELAEKENALLRFSKVCQKETAYMTQRLYQEHEDSKERLLHELKIKFESRLKILTMSLREKLEAETDARLCSVRADYESEERSSLRQLEARLLQEREAQVQQISAQLKLGMKQTIEEKKMVLQNETAAQKVALSKQLELEEQQKRTAIKDSAIEEMRVWEESKRRDLEKQMIREREKTAKTVLREQEERIHVLRQEVIDRHRRRYSEEIDKLKKALSAGAQAQLQQLHQQLEADHAQKMSSIQDNAKQNLKNRLSEVEKEQLNMQELKTTELQRDLDIKQRKAISQLRSGLDKHYEQQCVALQQEWREKTEQLMIEKEAELNQNHEDEIAKMKSSLQQEFSMEISRMEIQYAQQLEEKLGQLHDQYLEHYRTDLQDRRSKMQRQKHNLIQEANDMYTDQHSRRMQAKSNAQGPMDGNENLTQLKQLMTDLPKELQRHAEVLLQDFEELAEEHSILIDKFTFSTHLYLALKKQSHVNEQEMERLKNKVAQLNELLSKKQDICKKLYDANEALLRRFQIAPPSIANCPSEEHFVS